MFLALALCPTAAAGQGSERALSAALAAGESSRAKNAARQTTAGKNSRAADGDAPEQAGQPSSVADDPHYCAETVDRVADFLRREEYPAAYRVARERLGRCKGSDGLFLVGIAEGYLLERELVLPEERESLRAHALQSLEDAMEIGGLKSEWIGTAQVWVKYLQERAGDDLAAADLQPKPASDEEGEGTELVLVPEPRATEAPPVYRPKVTPWGSILLMSAGGAVLGASLVTALMGHSKDKDVERISETCRSGQCVLSANSYRAALELRDSRDSLYLATNVLAISGLAMVVGGGVWFLLSDTGDDDIALGIGPQSVQLSGRF